MIIRIEHFASRSVRDRERSGSGAGGRARSLLVLDDFNRRPTPTNLALMALTRSLNRVDLPVHTVGDPVERESPARAFAAQAQCARRSGRVRRPQPALSLRATRRSSTGSASATTRCSAAKSSRCSAATSSSSTAPTSTPRSTGERTDVRAPARHARPAGDLDPRRLLPGPQLAGPRARIPRHVQRRRSPEAARARGRTARAPPAPRHRQRRPADPVLRPPAQDPLRQQAVRQLDRRAGRRRARPRAEGRAAGGLVRARCRATSSARSPARR